jgi:hypothetical protein
VRGAEPGAREHCDRKADPHPHVDPDRRPLSHASCAETVRDAHDLLEQLRVRDGCAVVHGLAFEEVRDPVPEARLDVAVEAVVGDVQLPADVPLRVGRLPLEERGEVLEPRHAIPSGPLPELLERNLVDVRLSVRLPRELGRGLVPALLEQERVDCLVRHDTSSSYGKSVRFS